MVREQERRFPADGMAPLLEVQNLHVAYATRTAQVCPALVDVSFRLAPTEVLGVFGESGSGKSTLAAACLKLLPPNGKIQSGAICLEGRNVLNLAPEELCKIRGGRIGLINQEPSSALHPTLRIGRQVADVIAAHESLDRAAIRKKTADLLSLVFSSDAPRISRSYPHELSGGQRQRVLIAQAIACRPALLIADEPTASLDPTTQREILLLLRDLRRQLNLSVIFITHNPALLVDFADRIMVLYAGRIAEIGPASQVLSSPRHPYAGALLRSLPIQIGPAETSRTTKLLAIPGEPPDLSTNAKGCPFEPRCEAKMDVCHCEDPQPVVVGEEHEASCFKFAH